MGVMKRMYAQGRRDWQPPTPADAASPRPLRWQDAVRIVLGRDHGIVEELPGDAELEQLHREMPRLDAGALAAVIAAGRRRRADPPAKSSPPPKSRQDLPGQGRLF